MLQLDLRLPGAVRVGEPVCIELLLRNAGSEPIELFVPGRPPAFDLVIETEGGSRVWRRLEGKPIAMALGILQVEPGAEWAFEETWQQRSDDGAPVPSGAYEVRGILPFEGGRLVTARARLRIEDQPDVPGEGQGA